MIKKNGALILFAILVLAFGLRLYRLSSFPPSLYWDEAALGYNAYSLLKTGRDEYGKFLPLVFRSFNDYKPPLYFYLAIPSIATFGLNEFAIRLPSAILGTLTVLFVYLLTKELFRDSPFAISYSLLAGLLLATSPWHLHFSRPAFEANVALFFIVSGTYFLVKQCYPLSAICYVLSTYSYHSARLFIPLFLLSLFWIFKNKLWREKRKLAFCILLIFLLELPQILILLSPEGRARMSQLSVLSYNPPREEIGFGGEGFLKLRMIIGRYLAHFSPVYLFIEGDQNPRFNVRYMGLFYEFLLPFFLLGIYTLIKEKKEIQRVLLSWLLLAPIPAALTIDEVHALRALNMIIPLVIIISLGVSKFLCWLRNKPWVFRSILYPLFSILYLYGLARYLDSYYLHTFRKFSQDWQYGYKQAIEFVSPIKDDYQKVVFTDKYREPHIYVLFYEKTIANYEFRPIHWPGDRGLENTLFVGTPEELPEKDISFPQARDLKEIRFLNGSTAFRIVETP